MSAEMHPSLPITEDFELPAVWVINRSAHDYSGAARWGHVKYMSEGPVNRYATGKIFRLLNEPLRESRPNDYILLTGLTVMACIACSIFALRHKRLNLLIFRPATHTYVERRMNLEDLDNGN
jgi:hypothetical protein